MTHDLILSVEEVAYAMGVLGGTEAATGFLLGLLGQRPQQEVEGRLLAAAHSLVARGYLEFDASANSSWLVDSLHSMIKPLVYNDCLLRLSRVHNGYETVSTLYVSDSGIVLHQLYKSVASHLQWMHDLEQACEACWKSTELTDTLDEEYRVLTTIRGDLIDASRRDPSSQSVDNLVSLLAANGLSMGNATDLAQDLLFNYSRSSVIRLSIVDGEVTSHRGFLVLQGTRRNWLFEIDPTDPDKLRISPGSFTGFRRLFTSLAS